MDATERIWRWQLDQMNGEIQRKGALMEYGDFTGVDPQIMGDGFINAYCSHISTGYARGWL